MPLRFVGLAAEFREHQGFDAVAGELHLSEIHMAAVHIALLPPEPAGGAVDKAGIIPLFEGFKDIIAVKLAPGFVEDGPVTNAGMVFQLHDSLGRVHQEAQPVQPVFMHIFVLQLLDARRWQRGVPEEIIVGIVHHILPYDHAQFIALIVKFLRLHLDMLSQGIEAQLFHGQNIPFKALRGRSGEQAFRPVALIQQAMEEIGLAV